MARLSITPALATPERTSEEADAQSLNHREGATSTRKQYSVRDMAGITTIDPRAMGQAESLETQKQRSQAVREASRQAIRPGKLPRLSGHSPYSSNGPRRLHTNPLAHAKPYDVPSDDENTAPRRARQPVEEQPFSPRKRNVIQHLRTLEDEDSIQRKLDGQFDFGDDAGAHDENDTGSGSRPRESPIAAQDILSDAVGSENDAHHRDCFPDRLVHETEHAHNSEDAVPGADSPAPDQESEGIDLEAYASNLGQHEESVSEQEQQSSGNKRKRGRPAKAQVNDQGQSSAHPESDGTNRRKPGRPPNSAKWLHGIPTESATPHALQTSRKAPGRPPKRAAVEPSSAQSTPNRLTRQTIKRNGDGTRRSTRLAGEQPVVRRSDNTTTRQPERRPKQLSMRSHAATNGHAPSSSTRLRANPDHETSSHDRSDVAQPHVEHPVADDLDYAEQPQHIDENAAGADEDSTGEVVDVEDCEDDEDADDDDPEYDNDPESSGEVEEQPELSTHDRNRLFGHWGKVRTMMQEVAKHKGSTVRIKDDAFKKAIADCKEARSRVRATTANTSADELVQTVTECQNIIGQAREICGSGTSPVDHRNKKRGFHIFKHLVPALARLFKAVLLAFERVDIEAAGMQQISLDHLRVILDLMRAITECEESAYHEYQSLAKPIKRDFHTNISIPLRDLHSSLEKEHRKLFSAEQRRQANEEIAREFAEMEEERVRRAQRRHLETRNRDEWKRLNNARIKISINTFLLSKMNHLRSCPMTLVETADDGRPFLPDFLRPRAGVWTREERRALVSSLARHADTPDPLKSRVFDNVMEEQCRYGRSLADKNLLEIIIKSNEIMGDKAERCAANGIAVDAWVETIPNWMEVVRYGRVGASAEHPIEFE